MSPEVSSFLLYNRTSTQSAMASPALQVMAASTLTDWAARVNHASLAADGAGYAGLEPTNLTGFGVDDGAEVMNTTDSHSSVYYDEQAFAQLFAGTPQELTVKIPEPKPLGQLLAV